MPSALTLGGFLVALTLHADAPSPNSLYFATVKVPVAEVRCGPSDDPKMYATNRLRQGSVVEVVEDPNDGWLGIRPPSGSFDWINTRFLQRDNPWNYIVVTADAAPVSVLIGSELLADKPTVEGKKKLARGTQVFALGQPIADKKDNDGLWLAIEPPVGEVRYIRADQVTRNPTSTVVTTAMPPLAETTPPVTPTAGAFTAPPTATPAASSPLPPPVTHDPRLAEAEQLEKEGKIAEAEKKYTELANEYMNTNHELAMQCTNRAFFLRESLHGGTAAASGTSRLTAVPAGSSGSPAPPQTQQVNYATAADSAAAGPLMISDPGKLRPSSHVIDGKPAFVFISDDGRLIWVASQNGIDLEAYRDRNVRVTGHLVYRMDLRAHYMSVQQVTPLP